MWIHGVVVIARTNLIEHWHIIVAVVTCRYAFTKSHEPDSILTIRDEKPDNLTTISLHQTV